MMGLSLWHIIAIGVVVLLVFGKSFKISDVMGDVAKGIKSFKKGLAEDDTTDAAKAGDPLKTLDHSGVSIDKATDARKVI